MMMRRTKTKIPTFSRQCSASLSLEPINVHPILSVWTSNYHQRHTDNLLSLTTTTASSSSSSQKYFYSTMIRSLQWRTLSSTLYVPSNFSGSTHPGRIMTYYTNSRNCDSNSRSTGTRRISSSSDQDNKRQRRRHNHNLKQKQNQQIPKNTTNNVTTTIVFATIEDAQDSMQELLDRLEKTNINSTSNPITVEALSESESNNWNEKYDNYHSNSNSNSNYYRKREKIAAAIYNETMEFFDTLIRSVNDGLLLPSRKHGHELSQLVECVLYAFGQTQKQYYHNISSSSSSTNSNDGDGDDRIDIDFNNNDNNIVRDVLKVLEIDWNLDISNQHYDQAIAAACNVYNWEYASNLFEKQINPNAGGTPVSTISIVHNPLGLYAMTQRYNSNATEVEAIQAVEGEELEIMVNQSSLSSSMTVEHVMDAVQRLVMVSPQDQTRYVLAAGNALGYAGHWKEFDEYRRSSFLSEQYGTSLVSAVIQACCLCGKYDEALQILQEENIIATIFSSLSTNAITESSLLPPPSSFSTSRSNLGEEWQWGGKRDRIDPLCRDLAMQVIGGHAIVRTGSGGDGGGVIDVNHDNQNDDDSYLSDNFDSYSKLALMLFQQSREESVTISREALLGVVEACERDKDWKSALSILRTVIEEDKIINEDKIIEPWIVPGSHLTIIGIERDQIILNNNDGNITTVDNSSSLLEMGPFLASIMRNCNSSSNFGMALFSLRLFQLQLFSSGGHNNNKHQMGQKNTVDDAFIEDSIGQTISRVDNSQEILTACMVALCGLRCHENAMRLYEIQSTDDDGHDVVNASAALVYQYASSNQKRVGTVALGNPWVSAHQHIDQLTTASKLIQKILRRNMNNKKNEDTVITENQREMIEEGLARAMNSCTNAHQPELSLYLLEWMDESVLSPQYYRQSTHNNNNDNNNIHDTGVYKDSVTAETILARRWTRDLTGATKIFESILEKHAEDDLDQWRKTIAAGLTVMVANGRGSDAVQVFEVLDEDARSTDCYTTIGRHLQKVKDWKELIGLYRNATAKGYSSEELSLLAMTAVISTKVDNRLRILRAIVDECASTVGLDPKRWTMTKYWQVKRKLGFFHARLLMWWNDEQRAPLDEVNLAIKEFYKEKANGMRPKNDVVRAIVSGASIFDSLGLEYTDGYEQVPRSVENWTILLEEVLHVMKGSPIRYDPNFVDSTVQAYKSLGRSKECVQYISNVLGVDGTRIRRSTLVEVLEAARVEHAEELYNDIQMLLSRGNNSYDTSPQSLDR